MKEDAEKRSDEFYDRANKLRGVDDINSNLSNINGFLNAHMEMVYGIIEELMQAVNDINAGIDKLPTTKEFNEFRRELAARSEKKISPTDEEIRNYREKEKHSKHIYGH